jgi:hypothetical protein
MTRHTTPKLFVKALVYLRPLENSDDRKSVNKCMGERRPGIVDIDRVAIRKGERYRLDPPRG